MEREKGTTKIVSWKSLWAPGLNYAGNGRMENTWSTRKKQKFIKNEKQRFKNINYLSHTFSGIYQESDSICTSANT